MSELSDAVARLQSFKLDTLQATESIVDQKGQPTLKYQAAYQKLVRAIQQAIVTLALSDTNQDELLTAIQLALNTALAAQADLSVTTAFIRTRDSAVSGLTIDADTSSITVSTHDRQYLDPSETVSVTGDTITGLSSSTTYYIHYTDSDYSGGTVGYQVSTALTDATPTPTEPFRHYVGYVEVPGVGTASGTAAPDPYWKVIQSAGSGTGDLLSTNNLSDLASATTALTNLGLTANGKSLVTAADYAAMKALLDLEIGTDVQAYNALLAAIVGLGSNGLVARTGAGTAAARTITAGAGISVTNGSGVAGNPTVAAVFSGAMVKKNADQTGANYSAGVNIAWDAEVYDTISAHDNATNNTRLTTPAGANYVQVGCDLRLVNVTAGSTVQILLAKTGTSVFDGAAGVSDTTGLSNPRVSVVSGPIPVTGGTDYFEATLTCSDTSIDITASVSNFWMRVLG